MRTAEMSVNDNWIDQEMRAVKPREAALTIEHFLLSALKSGEQNGLVGVFPVKQGNRFSPRPLIINPKDDGDLTFLCNAASVLRGMPKDIPLDRISNFYEFLTSAQ